jgi:hypothetical protein
MRSDEYAKWAKKPLPFPKVAAHPSEKDYEYNIFEKSWPLLMIVDRVQRIWRSGQRQRTEARSSPLLVRADCPYNSDLSAKFQFKPSADFPENVFLSKAEPWMQKLLPGAGQKPAGGKGNGKSGKAAEPVALAQTHGEVHGSIAQRAAKTAVVKRSQKRSKQAMAARLTQLAEFNVLDPQNAASYRAPSFPENSDSQYNALSAGAASSYRAPSFPSNSDGQFNALSPGLSV